MELNCDYGISLDNSCYVVSPAITEPETEVKSISSNNQCDKTNSDIQGVVFRTTVNFLPRGLNAFFPKLTTLSIHRCGLKSVCREDFSEFKNLQSLRLCCNDLTAVPDDLIEDLTKLKSVSFYGNQIEFMSSKLFTPMMNKELHKIDLQKNRKIDAIFSVGHPKTVSSFTDLMKIIDSQCLPPEHSKSQKKHVGCKLTSLQRQKLSEGLEQLLFSGKFSDFLIIVNKQKFHVHRNILAIQSGTFAELFEKDPNSSGMNIKDISPAAVKEFLRFLYTGRLRNFADKSLEIFELASKLKVPSLREMMEKLILEQLNMTNAFKIFQLAHTFQSDELKRAAFKTIQIMFPDRKLPEALIEDLEKVRKIVETKEKLDLAINLLEAV
jgi:hypothetical protein